MKLELANEHQVMIAQLLWLAPDNEAVNEIIEEYGREAETVRDLMIAARFDDITDFTQARTVLNRIFNRAQ